MSTAERSTSYGIHSPQKHTMQQQQSATVFYLTPKSADKPPGKGVHESLGDEADAANIAALKAAPHWRRRLHALWSSRIGNAAALDADDLALLRCTGDAELFVSESGGNKHRCTLLETLRSAAVDADEAADEAADEEEASVDEASVDETVQRRIMPKCTMCLCDLGYENPRQLCCKTYCGGAADVATATADDVDVVDLSAEDDREQQEEEDAMLEKIVRNHLGDVDALDRHFGTTAEASSKPQIIHLAAGRLRLLYQQAAVDGHLSGMRWLLRHAAARCGGAMWDEHAPRLAAELGHQAVLEFLLDEGCPANPPAVCAAACRGGHLALLQMLREQYEADWDERCVEACCVFAERGGGAKLLSWLLEHGAPVHPRALRLAIRGSALAACQMLHAHDPSLLARGATVEWTALAAHEGTDPRLLQWLHMQGAPWDATCTAAAAGRSDPQLLAWARSRGCPWDATCTAAAVEGLRPDCLEYCIDRGCPIEPSVAALHHRLLNVIAHSRHRGAEIDVERAGAACTALLQPRLPVHAFFRPPVARKRRRINSSSSSTAVAKEEEEGSVACMSEWLQTSSSSSAAKK